MDECLFCGWTSDVPGWITHHRKAGYGTGPKSQEDYDLCQFCYHSYAASRWLTTGHCESGDKDRMVIANMLLAAQGIAAIQTLMLTLRKQEEGDSS